MRRVTVVGFVLALCLALGAGASWADMGADCKALVEKCAAMFKSKGKDATLKAINDPKGPFINGELYIFAATLDNKVVGHPHNKKLVGKDVSGVKDKKGKLLFVEFAKVAKSPGSGWVEYWWPKPGAKDPSEKRSYIMKVPNSDLYIGAGYYK